MDSSQTVAARQASSWAKPIATKGILNPLSLQHTNDPPMASNLGEGIQEDMALVGVYGGFGVMISLP